MGTLVRILVLPSVVAIAVVAIFAVVTGGGYRGFAEPQDFTPPRASADGRDLTT